MELDKLFEKLGQKKMATIEPAEVNKSDWNNCNIVMHECGFHLRVESTCSFRCFGFEGLVSSVYKQHDSLSHAVVHFTLLALCVSSLVIVASLNCPCPLTGKNDYFHWFLVKLWQKIVITLQHAKKLCLITWGKWILL